MRCVTSRCFTLTYICYSISSLGSIIQLCLHNSRRCLLFLSSAFSCLWFRFLPRSVTLVCGVCALRRARKQDIAAPVCVCVCEKSTMSPCGGLLKLLQCFVVFGIVSWPHCSSSDLSRHTGPPTLTRAGAPVLIIVKCPTNLTRSRVSRPSFALTAEEQASRAWLKFQLCLTAEAFRNSDNCATYLTAVPRSGSCALVCDRLSRTSYLYRVTLTP